MAWMGDVPKLPCFLDGGNHLPLIHVDDLAKVTQYIISATFPGEDDSPEELDQYLLAIDSTQLKFKEIIVEISKVFNGPDELLQITDTGLQNYDYVDYLTLDLKFEPGTVASWEIEWKFQEGFVQNIRKVRTEYEKKRNLTPLKIAVLGPPLSGKSDLSKQLAHFYKIEYINIGDVVSEYVLKEKQLEDELFELDKDRILAKREKERLKKEKADLKQKRIEEREKRKQERLDRIEQKRLAREEKERLKQEKEDNDDDNDEDKDPDAQQDEPEDKEPENEPEDEPEDEEEPEEDEPEDDEDEPEDDEEDQPDEEEEEDPEDNSPVAVLKRRIAELKKITGLKEENGRFSDKALTEMMKSVLARRICKNQGWVLDGYPKTISQTKLLMLKGGEDGEEEEEEEDEEPADNAENDEDDEDGDREEDERTKGKKANPATMPEYVISLTVDEEDLLSKRVGTIVGHNDSEALSRRLSSFKENNTGENSIVGCLEGMITKGGVQPLTKEIVVSKELNVPKLVDVSVEFIGEPHNYGPSQEELDAIARGQEEKRRIELEKLEHERQMKIKREQEAILERERVKKEDLLRLEEIRKQERELLEIKSKPLRNFLMETILPVLTKGLIEVVQVQPEDPIDYLSEWLFKHADEFDDK
jgi:adenylate kinase family enzyme